MSYWTFTDVFEENGPVPRPFHGGFGLINYEGIRKPAFWAYKFLSMLGPTERQNNDASSYVCTDGKGGAQVLLWDLTPPTDGGKISNQDYFFKPYPAQDKGNVTVNLSGLQPGRYQLSVYEIGYHQNEPYSRYLEMGSPTDFKSRGCVGFKAAFSGKSDVANNCHSERYIFQNIALAGEQRQSAVIDPTKHTLPMIDTSFVLRKRISSEKSICAINGPPMIAAKLSPARRFRSA